MVRIPRDPRLDRLDHISRARVNARAQLRSLTTGPMFPIVDPIDRRRAIDMWQATLASLTREFTELCHATGQMHRLQPPIKLGTPSKPRVAPVKLTPVSRSDLDTALRRRGVSAVGYCTKVMRRGR
jgi:hypothetical protein